MRFEKIFKLYDFLLLATDFSLDIGHLDSVLLDFSRCVVRLQSKALVLGKGDFMHGQDSHIVSLKILDHGEEVSLFLSNVLDIFEVPFLASHSIRSECEVSQRVFQNGVWIFIQNFFECQVRRRTVAEELLSINGELE